MDLRHLRYFVAVAETGSFRRAAERLEIGQPPLSVQIKHLEKELGAALFERTTRVVRLTPAGNLLLPQARALLAGAQRFREDAQRAARGEFGSLALGTIPSSLGPVLAAALRHFRAAMPAVRISVSERRAPEQLG